MAAATTTSSSYSSPLAGPVPWAGRTDRLEEVREHLGERTRCTLSGPTDDRLRRGQSGSRLPSSARGRGQETAPPPFVGRAGELLTQMIEKGIGIPRDEVWRPATS
ncbi:MAG: hypothetical protein R3E53_13450 [Myxococcota bacterium]